MMRRFGPTVILGAVLILAGPARGQSGAGSLTTQDPASAQPTLPKPMPDLTVPTGQGTATPKVGSRKGGFHVVHRSSRHYAARRAAAEDVERPALASVELSERLPYPPQPPHVTVPVPAYLLENLVTAFTTPPPPIVCRRTRRDRFQPDPHLVGDTPVLCTADNP